MWEIIFSPVTTLPKILSLVKVYNSWPFKYYCFNFIKSGKKLILIKKPFPRHASISPFWCLGVQGQSFSIKKHKQKICYLGIQHHPGYFPGFLTQLLYLKINFIYWNKHSRISCILNQAQSITNGSHKCKGFWGIKCEGLVLLYV